MFVAERQWNVNQIYTNKFSANSTVFYHTDFRLKGFEKAAFFVNTLSVKAFFAVNLKCKLRSTDQTTQWVRTHCCLVMGRLVSPDNSGKSGGLVLYSNLTALLLAAGSNMLSTS